MTTAFWILFILIVLHNYAFASTYHEDFPSWFATFLVHLVIDASLLIVVFYAIHLIRGLLEIW